MLMIGVGGLAAFLLRRKPFAAAVVGCGALIAGALSALALTVFSCTGNPVRDIFLLTVLILAPAAGFHSIGYLAGHGSERSGYYWCFFDLTVLAMMCVTQAQTAVQFLVAWEIMGAASFALVIFDRESAKAWSAGWIYLLACHAGAAFLITIFCFPLAPALLFVLALIGFGLKIGFPLLHVWLPEAHPAAPAPVSALMSGAMIELGFLGLITYGIAIENANWMLYGWVLTILGIVTALGGIIFAIAQSNLKKLLAYSSIENMGILSTALGMAMLGKAYGSNMLMISALAGFVIHLLNHALLKGGLFLSSGSVYKAAGTLDMDETGGLLKRMPVSGTLFIFHGLSLCGLPPSSGFAAEFLIYTAALIGLTSGITSLAAVSAAVLVFIALTGGLAAAAFAKAIGSVFCGEPRSEKAAQAVEVPLSMRIPVVILFIASFVLMNAIPFLLEFAGKTYFPTFEKEFLYLSKLTSAVAFFSCGAVVLIAVFAIIRRMLVRKSGQRVSITWDCGYAKPSAKME